MIVKTAQHHLPVLREKLDADADRPIRRTSSSISGRQRQVVLTRSGTHEPVVHGSARYSSLREDPMDRA